MQKGQTPVLILVGIVIIISVAGGAYFLGKSAIPKSRPSNPVVQSPQPTPTPKASLEPNGSAETANWKTYKSNGFTFSYPSSMYIQNENINEVRWKSDYTPGSFVYNSMILRSQTTPFKEPVVEGTIVIPGLDKEDAEGLNYTITNINDSQTILINSRKVQRYTFGCSVDCYFHMLHFQSGDRYYELISDGAGGGLLQRFNQILSTFKFQ